MKKLFIIALSITFASFAFADDCDVLPRWKELQTALKKARGVDNGGLNNDIWATLVDRNGVICAVTFTGKLPGDQWPGSRGISAMKAFTANGFSLPGMALSTANLYSASQPGGFMFGIAEASPVETKLAYEGKTDKFGSESDPMVGRILGGTIVFGGGLPLYNEKGKLVGGLGVSGDTSCADHNIAWRTRQTLKLSKVPKGMSPDGDDNIVYLSKDEKPNGYKHPLCGNKEDKIKL